MILEVTPGGIDQIDPATNKVLCSYDYRNIEGFVDLTGYQGGFCILYGGFSRLVSTEATSRYCIRMFMSAYSIVRLQCKLNKVCVLVRYSCGSSWFADRF